MPLYIHFPSWLSPVIIPGLPLRWYGMMYLVAFAITYLLTVYQVRRELPHRTTDDVINLFFWSIVGLLVGARIFAATVYDPTGYYLRRPWLIFWPFDDNMNFTGLQGMSYHGGLIGAAAGFLIYARVRRFEIISIGDMAVTAVPLGYTFGRIGNFINGELYGRVTSVSWGVVFPHAERVPAGHPAVQEIAAEIGMDISAVDLVNLPRHPSQLYEALLEGVVLWAVMWFIFRRRKPYPGFMVGLYVVGYAFARFVAEYYRQPDAGLDFIVKWGPSDNPRWLLLSPLNITTGQVLSLLMMAAGFVVLAGFYWHARRAPKVETFEPSVGKRGNTARNRRRRGK